MSWPLFLAGCALLALVCLDVFKTTLTLRGAGPISGRLSALGMRGVVALHRRRASRRVLAYAGPVLALSAVMGWFLLEWIAWTIIFLAGDPGVLSAQQGMPAGPLDVAYYAGFALLTLGLGDFRPAGPLWQVLTNLAAANGFLTISLSATYLIPMVSAAVVKRGIAVAVHSLGRTPHEIVAAGWSGRDFSLLAQHLMSLAPQIIETSQKHLAYPMLHYYHDAEARSSLLLQIVVLHEALLLLRHGVAEECRLRRPELAPAWDGVGAYLGGLDRLHLDAADATPPPPALAPLRAAGIPVVSDASFARAVAANAPRRRLCLALLAAGGWTWDDVWRSG